MHRKDLGSLLREHRHRRSMTQAQLAELGAISIRHLSFIENGKARPGDAVLKRLLSALRLTPRERNVALELAGYVRERIRTEPDAVRSLRTPEELRAVADPLRLDLLRVFGTPGRSPAMAADLLRIPATRVYHHVKILEEAGLIEKVEERARRGAVERTYRAVASLFRLDARIAGEDRGACSTHRDAVRILEDALLDVATSRHASSDDRQPVFAARAAVSLDVADLEGFIDGLRQLLAEHAAADESAANYRVTLVGAPVYDA